MIISFSFLLFSISNYLFAQNSIEFIKTTGVYIYDNGIRTYTPAAGAFIDSIKKMSSNTKEPLLYKMFPQTCIPKGTIGAGINDNSMIEVMMFSGKGEVLEYTTACRDEKTWGNIKDLFYKFQVYCKKPIAKEFGVFNVEYLSKNSFYIAYDVPETFKDAVQSTCYYTVFKDSIIAHENLPSGAFANDDGSLKKYIEKPKVYRFTSLTEVPESFKGGVKILKTKHY